MNLAQALLKTPKIIKVAPIDFGEPSRNGSHLKGPNGFPHEFVVAAGLTYAIGQVSTLVTWRDLAAWCHQESGVPISPRALRNRVVNHAMGLSRAAFATRNHETAQYYILCRLHGMKRPWSHIADRAKIVHQNHRASTRIALDTLRYMREVMG